MNQDVNVQYSLFKSGYYRRCVICGKDHRNIMVIHYGQKEMGDTFLFCSEKCLHQICGNFDLMIPQRADKNKKGFFAYLYHLWGDYWARQTGHSEFSIDPKTGTIYNVFHIRINDPDNYNKLKTYIDKFII